MHLDSTELAHVADASGQRFDMYAGIHKALRAQMADALLAIGRMDPDDAADREQATGRVLQLLAACAGHLGHENDFVHAAMEARAPGASAQVAHEHDEHLRHIAALADQVAVLRAGPDRQPAAARLYGELALFIADNLRHMHVEETAHNAVLWARYTDAELLAIHDALVAAIPPEEMMGTMRWMLPFMNPAERAMLLADVRAKAPAPAFDAMLAVARPHLDAGEWCKLVRAMDLPGA